MSFTVFIGNLPTWVTADDIKSWLNSETLVADSVKVIRHPETQESKGFAFIDAPNAEEMNAIIRRFDRAPLEDKLLRANPAQPPKAKGQPMSGGRPAMAPDRNRAPRPVAADAPTTSAPANGVAVAATVNRTATVATSTAKRPTRSNSSGQNGSQSAFAEELAKAL